MNDENAVASIVTATTTIGHIDTNVSLVLTATKNILAAIAKITPDNQAPNWAALFARLDELAQSDSGISSAINSGRDAANNFYAAAMARFDQLELDINPPFPPDLGPTILRFELPTLLTKQGVPVMPASVVFSDNHDFRVGFKWTDDVGSVHAPLTGTVLVSSDPAIATADVAPDDMSMVIRSVADGTCVITATNGALSDTCNVTVSLPTPTSLMMDTTVGGPVAKGTPA